MTINSKMPSRNDRGMTLIELLVVLSIMGTIAASLSLIITTVLRLSPTAEGRNDDANALLTLTAFMPEDVNSTAAGDFELGEMLDSGCSITNADPGRNLVRMTWEDSLMASSVFTAAYRFEDDGGGFKIIRYTCVDGGVPRISKMSEALPPINLATWTKGDAPVSVVENTDAASVVNGLTFEIDTLNGDRFTLEMRTNDLDDVLPAVPPSVAALTPPGNQAPVANSVSVTAPNNVPVDVGIPASDPDGEGLSLVLVSGPPSWTYSISGLTLRITPKTSLGNHVVRYRVTDPWGVSAEADVNLNVVNTATLNAPPTAGNVVDTVVVGTDLVINLPISDPDGDALTVTTSTPDPSLTVTVNASNQLIVSSDGTNSGPLTFNYTVDDGAATATGTVDLTITSNPCNVTSLSPSSASVKLKNNGYLQNTVQFDVTYSGDCSDLLLAFDNNLDDATYDPVYLAFGAGTSVTHQGKQGGLKWTLGNHDMTVQQGEFGSPLDTATMDVTP